MILPIVMLASFMGLTSCFALINDVKSEVNGVSDVDEIRPDVEIEVEGVTFVMKFVQGGRCSIGDPSNARNTTVQSFYMGETEVTQELWEAVMGKNPSRFQKRELDFHWGQEDNTQRPVEQISWNDCQVFIEKLNELTGKTFRMPTYPEWEYAAKGGKKGKNTRFSGSDDINAVAWYNRNSGWSEITLKNTNSLRTQRVKQKAPNELGLYDMTGNVREWVQENKEGLGVIRGGGFHTSNSGCEVWKNELLSVKSGDSDLGLRLVMTE